MFTINKGGGIQTQNFPMRKTEQVLYVLNLDL